MEENNQIFEINKTPGAYRSGGFDVSCKIPLGVWPLKELFLFLFLISGDFLVLCFNWVYGVFVFVGFVGGEKGEK